MWTSTQQSPAGVELYTTDGSGTSALRKPLKSWKGTLKHPGTCSNLLLGMRYYWLSMLLRNPGKKQRFVPVIFLPSLKNLIDDPLFVISPWIPQLIAVSAIPGIPISCWGFINFGEFAELTTKHKLGSPGRTKWAWGRWNAAGIVPPIDLGWVGEFANRIQVNSLITGYILVYFCEYIYICICYMYMYMRV